MGYENKVYGLGFYPAPHLCASAHLQDALDEYIATRP